MLLSYAKNHVKSITSFGIDNREIKIQELLLQRLRLIQLFPGKLHVSPAEVSTDQKSLDILT